MSEQELTAEIAAALFGSKAPDQDGAAATTPSEAKPIQPEAEPEATGGIVAAALQRKAERHRELIEMLHPPGKER